MKIIKLLAGWIITIVGFIGVISGLFSILDPSSAQLTDDNNPFGTPSERIYSIGITFFFTFIFIVGIWVLKSMKRTKNNSS
ncbi:MAG: hypothetical protein K9H64_23305 [Bacteroidales bacterium]|nr:hypothetical protein [Bacteroidales bacterium]MCF8458964.1 hypothetical protein [Bacteroidales bacterium]